jgi:DNA-binding response OmpR family regulator
MLFSRKKRRIERLLVVEDEPLLAFETEHFLRSEGFAVAATVDTVAAALQVIAADLELDLVLADVRLADGSGIEVARAAQGRGLPVLFVTGSFPEEARVLAAGCLAKPYPSRDLLAAIGAIEAVLEGSRAPKRLPGNFSLFVSPA